MIDFGVPAFLPQLLLLPAFILSAVGLSGFYRYFSKLVRFTKANSPYHLGETPAVSVIVCLRNEVENLKLLIPALMDQDYFDFEVILVADRSEQSTLNFLQQQKQRFSGLSILEVVETPPDISPKKHALTLGIQKAKNPVLLFTDADCLPASRNWIRLMASCYQKNTDIVLGYGAYRQEENYLNLLVRYETMFTAGNYMGMALDGKAYMGVGRNLSYRKSLFEKNDGFGLHRNVLSGDDDLFINRLATSSNVAICTDPESFTLSIPSASFAHWLNQKIRHQSAAIHYKPEIRNLLARFYGIHALGLVLRILLFIFSGGWPAAIVLFPTFAIIWAISIKKISSLFQEKFSIPIIIVLDVLYSFLLPFLAIKAILNPPGNWEK
jgi:glycosyltransferase involved in cell wall biosynthesis